MKGPDCRFCDTEAVVLVAMDQGCVCAPNDREQWLCSQHYYKATPLGSMEVIGDAYELIGGGPPLVVRTEL